MVRVSSNDPGSVLHASMPDRYQSAFDLTAAREHAAIVARRRGSPAHVEIWQRRPDGGAVLCVVADDRPGLLSFISAALVMHDLDIVHAQVFTRTVRESGRGEAIDFVTVRHEAAVDRTRGGAPRPVLSVEVARVTHVLRQLVSGEMTLENVARGRRPSQPPPPGASTKVTFDDAPGEGLGVLTVETFDRPGLLLAIAQALFRARVQIVASDATTQNGRVIDRFTIVELDHAPIRQARRGIVQTEVLAAIDSLARGPR